MALHVGRVTLLVMALMASVAAGMTSADPVLATPPGAGTAYGQEFPKYSVTDTGATPVNLTTPYAARRLGELIQGLDQPIGGQSLGSPIYVVDTPRGSSVEASPTGAVLIYRNYLEKLSGVTIDPARPATVDAAVTAMLNNGQRARSLQSIIAHELGHLTQGHGRFEPGTEYARRAQAQTSYIERRLNGFWFSTQLDEANRKYRQSEYAAGRRAPDHPSVWSHTQEYLADQHAVTTTYLKDGNLRGALDFWNRVGPGPGQGAGVEYAHPTRTARILNAVSFVEANPQLFADGLTEPVHLRVARDLPALELTRQGGKIVVTGREALVARLAPPEKLVFQQFQKARGEYYAKAGSPVQKLLYPEPVRYKRMETDVVQAFRGPAPPPSAAARAAASLHADVARGAILVGPALAVASGIAGRLANGDSVQDSIRGTARALDPILLATDAVAGTLGAAAGSMLPVPLAIAGLRGLGGVARAVPALGGAMIAARLATQALVLSRQGKLDARTLFGSIDWVTLGAQVVGSAIGMNLAMAAVSAGLLPALALGPVALVPLAAGIAGGILAEKLVAWWRGSRGTSAPTGVPPASAPAAPAPAAPARDAVAAARPASGGPRAPDDDPFGELRRAR